MVWYPSPGRDGGQCDVGPFFLLWIGLPRHIFSGRSSLFYPSWVEADGWKPYPRHRHTNTRVLRRLRRYQGRLPLRRRVATSPGRHCPGSAASEVLRRLSPHRRSHSVWWRLVMSEALSNFWPWSWEWSAPGERWILGHVFHGQPTVILRVSTVRRWLPGCVRQPTVIFRVSATDNRPWSCWCHSR